MDLRSHPTPPQDHRRARERAAAATDLQRRVTELEWLRDISRQVNAARTLDAVLDVVYEGIRIGLGYRRVGIQLFDQQRGLFEERRGTDAQGRKICATDRVFPLAPDAPIWGFPGVAALLDGAAYYYSADGLAATPPALRWMLDGASAHYLAVPLHAGAAVIGMISVDTLAGEPPLDPAGAGPLLALAHQVSTAIERARVEEALRLSEERFRTLVEAAPVGMCIIDERGVFEAVNPAFCALYGYAPAELIGQHFTLVVPAARQEELSAHYAPRLAEGRVTEHETEVCTKGGQTLTVLATWLVIGGPAEGRKSAFFVLDITERTRREAALAHQARHDALTGVPNRGLAQERVQQALRQAHRQAQLVAVLFVDLDGFKAINDTYGHAAGDQVLQAVAQRLTHCTRESDTVARWAGDEFVVLLPNVGSGDNAAGVAHKILAACAVGVTAEGHVVPISASIGISLYPFHGQDVESLVQCADQAMYSAKRQGVNTYQFCPEAGA